jgi:hypothetical protein
MRTNAPAPVTLSGYDYVTIYPPTAAGLVCRKASHARMPQGNSELGSKLIDDFAPKSRRQCFFDGVDQLFERKRLGQERELLAVGR